MAQSKILTYGLTHQAIEFFNQGMTEKEIADALTEILLERGVSDQVSQPTVNRFIKPLRDEFKNQIPRKFNKAVAEKIDSDLEFVDEAIGFFAGIARDVENQSEKTRGDAYTKGVRIIMDKVKCAMGTDDPEEVARRVADEIERNLDPGLREKLDDIRKTTGAGAVSGPH